MRVISKRLEALECAAETEAFANAFPFGIAYYLGGATHPSEVPHAYARALGYQNIHEFCQALADLVRESPENVDNSGIRARARGAQFKLMAKLGYDMRRARPTALADASYRIIRSLPEEWQATIKSGYREWCEAEAKATQFLADLTQVAEKMELAEKSQHARRSRRRRTDQRKPR